MRVIVATDRSAGASSAVRLVAGLSWPPGTSIDVVGVLEPLPEIGLVPLGPIPPSEGEIADARAALDRDAEPLRRPGITVRVHCFVGSPARRIVEAALAFETDLIVIGSRGRGAIATALLGSVAASLADQAPCPVLVARADHVDRLVLADDGSDGATAAADVLAWPVFRDRAIRIVNVVEIKSPDLPSIGGEVRFWDAYMAAVTPARERARRLVAERAKRFAGRSVRASVVEGDPAVRIADLAASSDLIIIGSRGQTGLSRLLLGSVSRGVLTGAHCSVLVVRGTPAAAPREPQPHREPVSV